MNPAALITGGTRGIGLAISKILCESGYDVAVNGVRDPAQVQDVMKELRSSGTEVIYCQGDIGNTADRSNIMNMIRSKFVRLNVLVNNAGVSPRERKDPLEASEESFDRVMHINLKGPYFLTQKAACWMVEQKEKDNSFSGSIINIGSISAQVVSCMRGEYCISKAGFSMHNKIWAVRMAEYDIPVYEIQPGIIKTDMTASLSDKYDKLIEGGLNVQPRWGQPEDIAKAVYSLVQGFFPFSTGETFMIDGGLTLRRL